MNKDRIKISIAISLAVHLGLLCLIGTTSAARPIEVEQLKIVKVELANDPDQVLLPKAEEPKPAKTEAPKLQPNTHIPSLGITKNDSNPGKPSPKPAARTPEKTDRKSQPRPSTVASSKLPGDPGGTLNTGTASVRGEDLGHIESGKTPVGWVPSPVGGRGSGSGTGKGVGRPDPLPNAVPGPGREPSPQGPPPPAPPPPPKMIEVRVCKISGDKPNPNCENTVQRSFVEGREPRGTCTKCKPQPKHESRLAAAQDAERTKDSPVILPDAIRDNGIDATVTITYTVDTNGNVSEVSVTKSSGNPAVDKAVVSAAGKMKYKPAMQDGIPRSVKMRRTYRIRC